MKIVLKKKSYEEVLALKPPKQKKPQKPNLFWRTLLKLLSSGVLKKEGFTYTIEGMEKVGEGPCLILMNHSSFMDLEIAEHIFYPKPLGIVCTSDGFIGKDFLMRWIGCIPTKKFVSDPKLISDIRYALDELKINVLMYPEASYSFDGTATPLPRRLGVLLKRLGVPVVMIETFGAFARQPLYNCLKKREVPITAKVYGLLSKEEIKEKSVEELDSVLDQAFAYDHFRWQQENKVKIDHPDRAEGLERILYKCPHCGAEGKNEGKGISMICKSCGAEYELDEYGCLRAKNVVGKFDHIPAWFAWERQEVQKELFSGTYKLETAVRICMMVDHKSIYEVGEGTLTHNTDGFTLTGCDGKLQFHLPPTASYSLYADYYWYEHGDIICIGNNDCLYYCFPDEGISVAKARLATEELYKIKKNIKG
ncbi:MAG: 1-acyl-sn-glycerol-3-phosphate acyltransferase [Clostridia bacterium]|nr:1-acyl-sn-glycerol-3-phosphate acyltransferase [Clostridia bacterium]